MKKLTARERKLILRCAETVDKREVAFSCCILANELNASVSLLRKYRYFYDQGFTIWRFEKRKYGSLYMDGSQKDWRVMCLLFFAEVG
jgi:hypothetical protein